MDIEEMKLRAYHKTTNGIYDVKCIDFTGECEDCADEPCAVLKVDRIRSIIATFDSIVLLRYTTFKDIHGKYIYEGDIITAYIDVQKKVKVKGVVGMFYGAFGIQCIETLTGTDNHDNEIIDLEELFDMEIVDNYFVPKS